MREGDHKNFAAQIKRQKDVKDKIKKKLHFQPKSEFDDYYSNAYLYSKEKYISKYFEDIADHSNDKLDFFENFFASRGVNVYTLKDSYGRNIIHNCAFFGNIEALMRYTVGGAVKHRRTNEFKLEFLDSKDKYGYTPLQLSCIQGYPEKTNEYINPYSPTIINIENVIADMYIPKFLNGRFTIGESLFQTKESYDFYSFVPVSFRYLCVLLLINIKKKTTKTGNSGNLNFKGDVYGYTPLHWAIFHGDFLLSDYLFAEEPAQIFKRNHIHCVPFDMAFKNSDEGKQIIVGEILNRMILDQFVKLFSETSPSDLKSPESLFLALRELSQKNLKSKDFKQVADAKWMEIYEIIFKIVAVLSSKDKEQNNDQTNILDLDTSTIDHLVDYLRNLKKLEKKIENEELDELLEFEIEDLQLYENKPIAGKIPKYIYPVKQAFSMNNFDEIDDSLIDISQDEDIGYALQQKHLKFLKAAEYVDSDSLENDESTRKETIKYILMSEGYSDMLKIIYHKKERETLKLDIAKEYNALTMVVHNQIARLFSSKSRYFSPSKAIEDMDQNAIKELQRIDAILAIKRWEYNILAIRLYNQNSIDSEIDLRTGEIKSKPIKLNLKRRKPLNEQTDSIRMIRVDKLNINVDKDRECLENKEFRIRHHNLEAHKSDTIPYYVGKIVHWLVFLGYETTITFLMEEYHISPFSCCEVGYNGIHMLCQYQLPKSSRLRQFQSLQPVEYLKRLLNLNLKYQLPANKFCRNRMDNSSTSIDMKEVLSIRTEDSLNTAIHLACISRSYQCFEAIMDYCDQYQIDIEEVNIRGWRYDYKIPREDQDFIKRINKSKVNRLLRKQENYGGQKNDLKLQLNRLTSPQQREGDSRIASSIDSLIKRSDETPSKPQTSSRGGFLQHKLFVGKRLTESEKAALKVKELKDSWLEKKIMTTDSNMLYCLIASRDNFTDPNIEEKRKVQFSFINALKNSNQLESEVSTVESQLIRIKKHFDRYMSKYLKEELFSKDGNLQDRQLVLDHLGFNFKKLSTSQYKELKRDVVTVKGNMFTKVFCFWRKFFPKQCDLEEYDIFVIQIGRAILKKHAIENKLVMYDTVGDYLEQFDPERSYRYEKFRDITKQGILFNILQNEFDVKKFEKVGILFDHFPMHNYKQRENILKYWRRWFKISLLNPINPFKTDQKAYIPVIQIGFYHGLQNGFFFQFMINYTSWTILLAGFGALDYIISMIVWRSLGNQLIIISWIVISLWSNSFLVNWKRTESTLAYLFDTKDMDYQSKVLMDYKGWYTIAENSIHMVEVKPKISSFYKRIFFTDTLFLMLGVLCLIVTYWFYIFLRGTFIGTYSAIINAILNFIIAKFYMKFAAILVKWENHKFKESKKNSQRIKNIVFEIVSSNITLIALTFIKDVGDLSFEVVKIVLTNSALLLMEVRTLLN